MISNQKDLIKAIGTFLELARANGDIRDVQQPGANRVWYGYGSKNGQGIPLSAYPYILLEDGGERTEPTNSTSGTFQNKFFNVEIEMLAYFNSNEDPLFDILDFSEQIKTVFEKEDNRLADGMTFGIQITPILYPGEQGNFYRGRRVVVEYRILEDTYDQY